MAGLLERSPVARCNCVGRIATCPGGISMRYLIVPACLALLLALPAARAYVEAPHSLGRCCHESTNIVLVELVRVSKEKNLLIYKKVRDIKGKHPTEEIKHNIGQRGFHPREWQNVMAWAEPGKQAVFFHNGGASETCIGTYWYQCNKEGDWWTMTHAEPFLLRTFYGNVDKLAALTGDIVAGKEVVVTCLADGPKEQLHLRRGKVQRLRASLKKLDYNPRRDFVGFGGGEDGDPIEEFKTFTVMAESTPGWRFLPLPKGQLDPKWNQPDFNDGAWRTGKAPIGYGEEELKKRQGTVVAEQGVPFLFRRWIDISADLLKQKGVVFRVCVASDDSGIVYLNGKEIDRDPVEDHEFQYWNREVDIPLQHLKPGKNLIAVYVKNRPGSSDIYLDMEITAQVPLPKVVKKPTTGTTGSGGTATGTTAKLNFDPPAAVDPKTRPLTVDRAARTVTVSCVIAPRKLPNLTDIYPIEVGATYPAPRGQKAHETVLNFGGVKPSDIHKALEGLGARPGKPAVGEGTRAEGPEVTLTVEFVGADGRAHRLPLERCLVNARTGKPLEVPALRWHFTGSTLKQPDPERDDKVYGADVTGTLITLYPVTGDTVFQSQLTMKEEAVLKLETDRKMLPREGTPARLIIGLK
jgi:hypothetical protein